MARTSLDLFRIGNASGPRMDNVRPKDIDIFDQSGVPWVCAGTGGISTFASSDGSPSPMWWKLAGGYDYGPLLLVWNDHGQHWLWEPVRDMPLSDFKAELAKSHRFYVRVTP